MQADADRKGDDAEYIEQRGNADQRGGNGEPPAPRGKRNGAGRHQRKGDDLRRGLQRRKTVIELQPVQDTDGM